MATIKYTKTQLRNEQFKLNQLQRYLPTLQLKKAMLQIEINQAGQEFDRLAGQLLTLENQVRGYEQLLTSRDIEFVFEAAEIEVVLKHFENIAGVEIPVFEQIVFKKPSYFLFDTSFWVESGIHGLQSMLETREKLNLIKEKKRLLEKELREVSIRVNLFEKIMIPRTSENIKKIKIFLGDQQLAAVSQAKVSKRKILERKRQK